LILNRVAFGYDQALVSVMITGSLERVARPFPGDIPIPNWQQSGLAKPSVVRPARFWSAEDRDVDRVIGRADPGLLAAVRTAVVGVVAGT
jgi:hypothetical protein